MKERVAEIRRRPARPAPLLSGEELAVDKMLAAFGRAEARDFIDLNGSRAPLRGGLSPLARILLASPAGDTLAGMAKPRSTQIDSKAPRDGARQTRGTVSGGLVLRPATRSLRDVLSERGPLTGPVTDAGTRALLAVRGERAAGEHDR